MLQQGMSEDQQAEIRGQGAAIGREQRLPVVRIPGSQTDCAAREHHGARFIEMGQRRLAPAATARGTVLKVLNVGAVDRAFQRTSFQPAGGVEEVVPVLCAGGYFTMRMDPDLVMQSVPGKRAGLGHEAQAGSACRMVSRPEQCVE